MTPHTDAAIAAAVATIYERWHDSVVRRDLDALMALYDEHARFESPLVMVASAERCDGTLTGKPRIAAFFAQAFDSPDNGLGRWYRTGTFFANGRQLVWEYPRETPEGDQVDLVEAMDIELGLIVHHRVYWGWVGVRALLAVAKH